jgi:predicted metal-binding protein
LNGDGDIGEVEARAAVLYVCTTCRRAGGAEDLDAPRAGAQLLHALVETGGTDLPFAIVGTECLSNCSRGCSVALAGEGRWTYAYGNLDPISSVSDILDGATRYAASSDGIVPWRERPAIFRKGVVARIPPLGRS